LLQDFTADIEREIFTVNDSTNESQVLRKQFLGIIHDEDALYVELDAALVFSLVQIERSL
jgi:hypothetical protein